MPDDDDPDAAPVKLNDLDYQRFSNAMKKPAPPTAALVDLFRDADLDCFSPAAPAALALAAERSDSAVIAAAIARGRERPHLVLIDRPKAEPEPEPIDVIVEAVNWCGLCGQTFRIAPDDPHWSTGRGPICPAPKAKP